MGMVHYFFRAAELIMSLSFNNSLTNLKGVFDENNKITIDISINATVVIIKVAFAS